MKIRTFCYAILAVCLSATASATVTSVKVTEGVYTFKGPMANCVALTTDDGALVIDSGETAQLGEELLAAVGTISQKPVRYLVNTHLHYDHVNGNAAFSAAGAAIVGQDNMRRSFTTKISPPNTALPPRELWPTISFSKDMTIYLGNEIVLLHHPDTRGAHTAGDIFIIFRRANVLVTGDIFFNGMYPYIDVNDNGWADGIVASCRNAALMIDDRTIVIPGHGSITDKKGLEAYAGMLENVSAKVRALIEEGKTLDEIKKARPSAEFDAVWGNGFVKPDFFVELIYAGIMSHKSPLVLGQ